MYKSISIRDYFELEQFRRQWLFCKSGALVSMYEFDWLLTGDSRAGFFLNRISRNKTVPENIKYWMTPDAIKKWITENERDVFEDISNFQRFYCKKRGVICKK